MGLLRGEHQPAQLVFVHRRADGEVGNRSQVGQIEGSVVRGTVFAHQSGAVEADDDGQVEDGRVVDDVVVGPLRKGRIDVAEGLQALFRHSRRECDGVAFGNAHVERAVGHFLHHDVHGAARGHGGCDAHDALVLLCQFEERFAEHVLEFRRTIRAVAHDSLARLRIEFARRMPNGGLFFRRFVAFSLRRVQMEQLRAAHILDLSQDAHQFHHVVTVKRAEIADVHALENVLLPSQSRFQRVVEADEALASLVAHHAARLEPLRRLEAQLVVGGVRVELQEVFFHAAHSLVDRHVVVVEDDEQVVVGRRHVVQALEGQSATHRAVANDGHDFSPDS